MSYLALNNAPNITLENYYYAKEIIDRLAYDALMQEVMATPKPGLVDMNNSGAHRDMNINTFIMSAKSLRGYFGECFLIGVKTQERPHKETLAMLQDLGKSAESKMFMATSGVNTHKGLIFSLGILCGAIGRIFSRDNIDEKKVRKEAANLCTGITNAAFCEIHNKPYSELTKGERMYIEHDMTGARGEAESGFASVGTISMPIFKRLLDQGISINDALVEALLYLIANIDDTNIISRHDMSTAIYTKNKAIKCLSQGGFLRKDGKAVAEDMDNDFISRNISPGGSADLLAVTYFLYNIQLQFSTKDAEA